MLATLNRAYRGDIETIVAKALEKDKARRYSSANALAADIRRYLDDQPIAARPPSARYQLRKFARRRPLGHGRDASRKHALTANSCSICTRNSSPS